MPMVEYTLDTLPELTDERRKELLEAVDPPAVLVGQAAERHLGIGHISDKDWIGQVVCGVLGYIRADLVSPCACAWSLRPSGVAMLGCNRTLAWSARLRARASPLRSLPALGHVGFESRQCAASTFLNFPQQRPPCARRPPSPRDARLWRHAAAQFLPRALAALKKSGARSVSVSDPQSTIEREWLHPRHSLRVSREDNLSV